MFVDPYGTEAYDLFDSLEDLLIDWAKNYSSTSFYMGREVGSLIYYVEIDNYRMCGYVCAEIGISNNVKFDNTCSLVPKNATVFATVHTHPAKESGDEEGLSEVDMRTVHSKGLNNNIYLESTFAVVNRGDTVAIYGYGTGVTPYEYDPKNPGHNKNYLPPKGTISSSDAEAYDTLLIEGIPIYGLSSERKAEIDKNVKDFEKRGWFNIYNEIL